MSVHIAINRSGSDERANSWNGQCANPDDPSQRSADNAAGACASDSAFGGFRVLLVREIAARALVGKQHGDVIVGEVRGFQLTDNLISLIAGKGDTEHGFL